MEKKNISKIYSATLLGIEASFVKIEVDIQRGLPGMQIIGLADSSVKEAKERVRSAIEHSGYNYPNKRIVVNLVPADLKKMGTFLDLGIAISILNSGNLIHINPIQFEKLVIIGELSLDGSLYSLKGVLSIMKMLKSSYLDFSVILPYKNRKEASLIEGIPIYPMHHLKDVISFLEGNKINPYVRKNIQWISSDRNKLHNLDFNQVKGQYEAKRAIEIACAGGHHLLMVGPPGAGKSMIAERAKTILPDLTLEESLETTEIYSSSGKLGKNEFILMDRPFRTPHHSSSIGSILGGGKNASPGEISLAHHGILFMDEFSEYRKDVIQALRKPLEDGKVHISRVNYTISYPCKFILIAAMNPCPCGYYMYSKKDCYCREDEIKKYLKKISGPIMDRIDIQIYVLPLKNEEIINSKVEEGSIEKKDKVKIAQDRQKERYKNQFIHNARMSNELIEKYCKIDSSLKNILMKAIDQMNLSVRSYYKILKISRTIADLDNRDNIKMEDVLEAIRYRKLDKEI